MQNKCRITSILLTEGEFNLASEFLDALEVSGEDISIGEAILGLFINGAINHRPIENLAEAAQAIRPPKRQCIDIAIKIPEARISMALEYANWLGTSDIALAMRLVFIAAALQVMCAGNP